MSKPSLLPEQEDLLCKLVEAVNRAKPKRELFRFLADHSRAGDFAIVSHPGWLPGPESEAVIGDLNALCDAKYIRLSPMNRGWKFDLTGDALQFYEKRLHPDESKYNTKVPPQVLLDDRTGVADQLAAPCTNKMKLPMKRASRAATMELLKTAMREHMISARDHAWNYKINDKGPILLPRPTQRLLAKQLNLSRSSVNRAILDGNDKELTVLWDSSNILDDVMNYKGK